MVDYCVFTHMHVCMQKCEGQRSLCGMSAPVSESTRITPIKSRGSSPDRLDFVCACTSPALFLINSWRKTFCNFCPHWPSLTVTHTPLYEQLKQLSTNLGAAFPFLFWGQGKDSDSWPGSKITGHRFYHLYSVFFSPTSLWRSVVHQASWRELTRGKAVVCVCLCAYVFVCTPVYELWERRAGSPWTINAN